MGERFGTEAAHATFVGAGLEGSHCEACGVLARRAEE